MKLIMRKLILTAVFAIICGTTSVFADALENKNAVGAYFLAADHEVGGLQYERRFSDLVSTKFGVFAFYNQDTYSDPFKMNITAETDFTLYANNWREKIASRLFAYGMVGYESYIERVYDYEHDAKKSEKMHNNALASVGFGFDFMFFDHLSVPIQFGFMGTFPDDTQVGFCGGIGIRYTW